MNTNYGWKSIRTDKTFECACRVDVSDDLVEDSIHQAPSYGALLTDVDDSATFIEIARSALKDVIAQEVDCMYAEAIKRKFRQKLRKSLLICHNLEIVPPHTESRTQQYASL